MVLQIDYVQQELLQIFFVNPETVPSELFPGSIYWFKALLSKSLKAFFILEREKYWIVLIS